MVVWNKVTRYSQITAIILGVVIFAVGYSLGGLKGQSITSESDERTDPGAYSYTYEMPSLTLPQTYFDPSLERGAGESITGGKYTVFDSGYQSFPTTTVSLENSKYSNERTLLPPIKTAKDILADADIYKDHFESQISEYGEYAQRYLPDDVITSIELFDVDKDGAKETIISLCSLGGNHCPHEVIVVKGDKILFQTTAGATGPNIIDSGFGNGFFVTWSPWSSNRDKWDVGLCCMPGYMKTRFVYEGDTFVPVYEQEVLYFKVTNADLPNSKQISAQTPPNEYQLFKTESSRVLLETSERGTTLTFVFRDQDSKDVLNTLPVSNVNIAAPTYRIEHGPTHDWLVVTRIDQSGTGYISYYDDWYTLSESYTPTLALSYESTERIVPRGEQYNTYVSTRIIELDSSLKVEKTTKNCIQLQDLTDGECTESKTEELYEFVNK